jgi:hypothetical protein
MKFTNVFSIGLVLGSALFATTALPITTNAIVAREPDVLVLARSFHELSARDPWFGKVFQAFKPFIKPLVSMIPKVGGTISKFIPREESDDELLEDLLQLASENNVAARSPQDLDVLARSFHELSARDPFFGKLFRIVRPFIKPVASAIGKFIKREESDEELLEDLLQLASENTVAARSFHELDARDPFFGKLFRIVRPFIKPVASAIGKFIKREVSDDELLEELLQLASENTVAARSFHELDARDPFLGRLFRVVRPFIKPVASALGKFIKREDGDITADDVVGILADIVADLKPSVSRRDADDAAWDDFVQALQDAAAR